MDDTERLVVLLEARIRDFERNMQKASDTGGRQFGRLRQDSQRATRQMEADMGRATGRMNQALATVSMRAGAVAAAFGPMAAGVGIATGALAGFVAQAQQTARGIATIGDEAKRAGISVKAFQELKFVADQNRVSVEALTDGIKEMNLRADEFIITGKGSGAEAFQRLGLTAADLAIKLKDPSALFTEIIGKLEHLDRAAQIRIADEVFGGTGGEQFVQLIDEGAAGIRRTMEEANRLGLVMDEAMIQRAAEVDRQFQAITQTVGTSLKGAIVDAAHGLAGLIDGFRDFENQRTSSLNEEVTSLGQRRLEIENKILALRGEQAALSDLAKGLGFGEMDNRQIAQLEEENAALGEQEAKILSLLKARGAFDTSSKETADGLRGLSAAGAAVGDSLGYIERNGGLAIENGVTKPSKEATKALKEAEAAKRALLSEAEGAVAEFFPFEAAAAEAERLLAIVNDTSNGLTDLQRAALRLQADQPFIDMSVEAQNAAGSVGDLRDTSVAASKDIGQAFASNVGSTLLDIFTDAGSGADSFFDRVISGFANIGRQSAEIGKNKLLETLFGSQAGYTAGSPTPGSRSVFPAGFPSGYGQPAAMSFSVPTPTSAMRQTSRQLAETVTESVSGNLLASVLGAGKSASHVTGLNTQFANSLTQMFAAAPDAVRSVTKINSGFRSVARQGELFEAAVAKYGSEAAARKWVAPPGRSNHNGGMAADLGFGTDAARSWFHQNAGSYGLKFPMGHEPWHIEAGSTRGGASSISSQRDLARGVELGVIGAQRRIATSGIYTATGADPWVTDSGIDLRAGPQQGLFGPRGQAGLSVLGAGAGAFFGGVQSGSPLSGGLSGAMSGLGAAGSIGALFPSLGAAAGPLGMAAGAALGCVGRNMVTRKQRMERMAA